MTQILALGEVLWDLLPTGERLGGAPANFACHAALLGADVGLVSAVGNDPRGRTALKQLHRCGVDVGEVQIQADYPTGTVGVELDSGGKPAYTIHADSAWDYVPLRDEIVAKARLASAVYFGTLGQRGITTRDTTRRILQIAKEAGIPRILDVNLRRPHFDAKLIRESIELASVVKLSDEELPAVCQAFGISAAEGDVLVLAELRKQHSLDKVVLTRGALGAYLNCKAGFFTRPGHSTAVVDSVGAGDAFTAAMVVSMLNGDSPADLLDRSCKVAASVCQHPGAVPTL